MGTTGDVGDWRVSGCKIEEVLLGKEQSDDGVSVGRSQDRRPVGTPDLVLGLSRVTEQWLWSCWVVAWSEALTCLGPLRVSHLQGCPQGLPQWTNCTLDSGLPARIFRGLD